MTSATLKFFIMLMILIQAGCIIQNKPLQAEQDKKLPAAETGRKAPQTLWGKKATGIFLAKIPLKEGSEGEYMTFIKLDKDHYSPTIISAESLGEKTMSACEIAVKSNMAAVINGSYFDEKNEPLGFLKIKGKIINNYIAEPIIYSGIVEIVNGGMSIIHKNDFTPEASSEALQAGPHLISNRNIPYGLENTIDFKEKSLRSGLAIDGSGNYIIFKTTGALASWKQIIATILSNPGLEIKEAINLDGGSSSQIYAKYDNFEFNEGTMTEVPIFIAFSKKNKR